MPTITGTAGNDSLVAGVGPHTIYGLGGNDSISGGPDDDTIYGGSGDDTIFIGESGNDVAYGEDGDDNFVIRRRGTQGPETFTLDGGAGNDRMHVVADGRHVDTARVYGGAGNDDIVVAGFASSVIDAGDGDDVLYLSDSGGSFDVTLGQGRDLVYFNSWLYGDFYAVEFGSSSYVFRDFAPAMRVTRSILRASSGTFPTGTRAITLSRPDISGWCRTVRGACCGSIRTEVGIPSSS